MEKILSLDMAFGSTGRIGFATVDLSTDPEQWNFGAWELNGHNFLMRCRDVVDHIEEEIGEFDTLIVEWPMHYDSQKGDVASRQGHTINLAGIAMFVVGWFQMEAKDTHLITAPTWKGTVKKEITARRFLKMFGEQYKYTDHNAIDAAMMLVWFCTQNKLTTA